jgi:hypothetical protein
VLSLAVRAILGGQTALIAALAQGVSDGEGETWPAAERSYRFISNERFEHPLLFEGAYRMARCTARGFPMSCA